MKPVIIFAGDKTPDDKYSFTAEELQKIVSDSYEAGYNDGVKAKLVETPIPNYGTPYAPSPFDLTPNITCNVEDNNGL